MKKEKSRNTTSKKYRKVTYPAAINMVKLVDRVPRHGVGARVNSLADELGVSSQTIHRYVKALAGHFLNNQDQPLFAVEKRGGEQWLVRNSGQEGTGESSIYRTVSAYLSLELFRMLGRGNVFAELADEVYQEMEKTLSACHLDRVGGLPLKFYSAPWAPRDYSKKEDVMQDVIMAVVFQRVLKIKYKTGEKVSERMVWPLTLLYHRGGFYLIAVIVGFKGPSYFALERIQQSEVQKEKFDYPANYHPEQMLDGAFGIIGGKARTFKLKFPAELADYIAARKWHKSQKLAKTRDGSVVLTLQVTDSEEVRSWVRSFGQKVEVLAPKNLEKI